MSRTLDDALHKLAQAMSDAGMPLWEASQSSEMLDQIDAEISPLRLTSDLREFWSRVDARTLSIQSYPSFTTPEFALWSWQEAREQFRTNQPLALFLVGYQSHGCLSVELDADSDAGGAVYEWFISSPSGFDKRVESLSEWIDYVSDLIEDGRYERLERSNGTVSWLVPDQDHAEDEQRSRPVIERIPHDVESWPSHWQRVERLIP